MDSVVAVHILPDCAGAVNAFPLKAFVFFHSHALNSAQIVGQSLFSESVIFGRCLPLAKGTVSPERDTTDLIPIGTKSACIRGNVQKPLLLYRILLGCLLGGPCGKTGCWERWERSPKAQLGARLHIFNISYYCFVCSPLLCASFIKKEKKSFLTSWRWWF